ncbi:uncharacterized protein LOC124274401 [Haliotis rubra]|uniref:uncharacterized protein LOC124274401 n=1 Tax=Haliotis rubra TaxID=36100 RepID=UPI001EE598EF|nr:uncharacterized protein LOC124274401 [Haliotis rubra]
METYELLVISLVTITTAEASSPTYNLTSTPATAYNLTSTPVITYNITSTPATAYNITSTPVITYFLTSTPATEGQPCILSCTHGLGRTISTALWYRNWVRIFQTNWRYQFEMLDKDVDHEEFRSVSGRISVDATLNRHNVILTINSTVDEESVWTCGVGVDTSNNLTVRMMATVTAESTTTTTASPATLTASEQCDCSDSSCNSVLAPVAAGVGAALMIAVAVNVLIWYRVIGSRTQKTKDVDPNIEENNAYCLTPYGGHHHSGDYTDIAIIRPVSFIEPMYSGAMEMDTELYINAVDGETIYEDATFTRTDPDISDAIAM